MSYSLECVYVEVVFVCFFFILQVMFTHAPCGEKLHQWSGLQSSADQGAHLDADVAKDPRNRSAVAQLERSRSWIAEKERKQRK